MAVYTDVSDEELEAFIASYDIGALTSFKGIAEGVENSNYLVHAESGPYILTLYEKRVRPEDLPYFLALMEHLAARGISCPLPVHDREGRTLRELAGRPAVIISFLEGLWVRRPSIEHCAGLGQALARFHLAGQDFPMSRANDLSLPGWQALYGDVRDKADEVIPGLKDEIAQELAHLKAHWTADLPIGVIHADLFRDNVLWNEGRIGGVIDFYFAGHDALLFDVAVTVNDWCATGTGELDPIRTIALLDAYNAERPFEAVERAQWPAMLRAAALRFWLSRAEDFHLPKAGEMVFVKPPAEYRDILRLRAAAPHVLPG